MARTVKGGEAAAVSQAGTGGREILLVEDLENDIHLLTRAFEKAGAAVSIRVLRDGQEAIEHLKNCGAGIPAMLLLDLRMPRVSGFEVLEWIRRDSQFRRLIVVVLSASDSPKDIKRAYDLGANSYMRKPIEFPDLVEKVRMLNEYWLGVNRLGGET